MVTDLPREIPIDEQLPENIRDRYVRVAFAADIVGAATTTLQRHLRMGSLAGAKIGRAWLIERNSLAVWTPGQSGPKPKKQPNAAS